MCDGESVELQWYQWREIRTPDTLHVDIYSGGQWTDSVTSWSNNNTVWTLETLNISSYLTDDFIVRFRLVTDNRRIRRGPYIDDLSIVKP